MSNNKSHIMDDLDVMDEIDSDVIDSNNNNITVATKQRSASPLFSKTSDEDQDTERVATTKKPHSTAYSGNRKDSSSNKVLDDRSTAGKKKKAGSLKDYCPSTLLDFTEGVSDGDSKGFPGEELPTETQMDSQKALTTETWMELCRKLDGERFKEELKSLSSNDYFTITAMAKASRIPLQTFRDNANRYSVNLEYFGLKKKPKVMKPKPSKKHGLCSKHLPASEKQKRQRRPSCSKKAICWRMP